MKEKFNTGFERANGGIPIVVVHCFTAGDDGQLYHAIDGNVRAIVPPEGWDEYEATYPEAKDVIDTLRLGTSNFGSL